MEDVFDRGNYYTFIVIAPAGNLDNPLFALPVFEGDKPADVFNYYVATYASDAKVIMKNDTPPGEPRGRVFATLQRDGDSFKASTIDPENSIWGNVVRQWEDQWVFDHIASIGLFVAEPTYRVFEGSDEIKEIVANEARASVKRYWSYVTVLGLLGILFAGSHNKDSQ